MNAERKKKVPVFWIGFLVFVLVLVAFWAVVIGYVYRCMAVYEAAQPERLVEAAAEAFRDGSALETMEFPHTRFESPEAAREAYAALLEGKEITYRKAAGHYDAMAPAYSICAQDTPVATVKLREKSSESLMFILTLQDWEVASVTPELETAEACTVVAPDIYTVRINGQDLGEEELTGNRYAIEDFQYAAAYVAVPELVEYQVKGLYAAPRIEVLDRWGQPVELVETGEGQYRADGFAPGVMDSELEAAVLKNAKDYSNFFSRDLAGCTASIAPIRPLFPEDSYYLELAENYRRHDMWMYSGHYAPTFSNEEVSNYTEYGEDFFSCDVTFDKKMILKKTGQERHDITNTQYYYVNLDGKWVIADMKQILDE